MMFPKHTKVKKRKKHKASILHQRDGTCYLCAKLDGNYQYHEVLHKHHVFGGPNRTISEAEGFTVHLCLGHHEIGDAAVHNNQENMRILQRDAQREYEKTHTREQFMKLIGRNYLDNQEKKIATQGQQDTNGFRFIEEDD